MQMMKRIYQDASHVIVWLGPSGEGSDFALDVMNQVGREACEMGIFDIPRSTWLAASPDHSGAYAKLQRFVEEKISLDHPFEAIARLSTRPYWSRVWVVQEAVLPRDVSLTCGFSSIPFPYWLLL